MRELAAATFANAAAPQAPARNPSPPTHPSLDTFNSHRRLKRPKLGDRRVYRPVRRHTLSRIDETPPKSLEDFSSTRPVLRSRSNISADTSRSVPVCNQSHEIGNQLESGSPQYAEPDSTSSDLDRPASMSDLPIVVPVNPPYVPYEYTYSDCRIQRYRLKKKVKKFSTKHNLYLAFMY